MAPNVLEATPAVVGAQIDTPAIVPEPEARPPEANVPTPSVILKNMKNMQRLYSPMMRYLATQIYPATHVSLGVITVLVYLVNMFSMDGVASSKVYDKMESWGIRNRNLSLVLFSFGVSGSIWLALALSVRLFLRALLTYHGWMHEKSAVTSLPTVLFMGILQFFFKARPLLYSFQGLLPTLPVPPLEKTLKRHLESMRPLLDDSEYDRLWQAVEEFKEKQGFKLQLYLRFRSLIYWNYVTDWFEKYAYLEKRSPLMINTNVYSLDMPFLPSSNQAARAARLSANLLRFNELIDSEYLEPIKFFKVPLCTASYKRLFKTCRIPGKQIDTIERSDNSTFLAVLYKGCWWKFPVYHGSTKLTAPQMEHNFQMILDSDASPHPVEELLPAFTAVDRSTWAEVRKTHFAMGLNRASLDVIEKAIFVVILDNEAYEYDENDSCKLDDFAHSMLHGNGKNRWFDKSISLIVGKNGRAGFNGEHACFDGLCLAHAIEIAYYKECRYRSYDFKGKCEKIETFKTPPAPTQLQWDFNGEVFDHAKNSYKLARSAIEDLDLALLIHNQWGKGFVKGCHISPDGFIQMVLQLAVYRDLGKFVFTSETCVTRFFYNSRTEDIRIVSKESCDFIRAMEDPTCTNLRRQKLLALACDRHRDKYVAAMCGEGHERHLFALHVASKKLSMPSPFLEQTREEHVILDTSQSPIDQTRLWNACEQPQYISGGGGFGPVAYDGYGVSYVIGGNDNFAFHISSISSCKSTSSSRLRKGIQKALRDMREIYTS